MSSHYFIFFCHDLMAPNWTPAIHEALDIDSLMFPFFNFQKMMLKCALWVRVRVTLTLRSKTGL